MRVSDGLSLNVDRKAKQCVLQTNDPARAGEEAVAIDSLSANDPARPDVVVYLFPNRTAADWFFVGHQISWRAFDPATITSNYMDYCISEDPVSAEGVAVVALWPGTGRDPQIKDWRAGPPNAKLTDNEIADGPPPVSLPS